MENNIKNTKEKIVILVAPYWNLNLCASDLIILSKPILVAPYWNLNGIYQ